MKTKYLLIRFSAIGDCVMAAWAATAIRQRHPEAYLCWAVQTKCAPVIDTQRLANQVWEIPRDRWKQAKWSARTWREQLLAYTGLRPQKFDVGIDLHGHNKTALCLRLSGAKSRLAARATDGFAKRLNPVYGERPETIHTVDWNMQVLSSLGDFAAVSPILPDSPEAIAEAKLRLAFRGRLATICVGASNPAKRYPYESWRRVASSLLEDGYQVVFLGGPNDLPIEMAGTLDLVGKLPLDVTVAAVRLSDVHLAADTGTGHIAAACGTPVVSIFGPTNPAGFRPYTNRGIVLQDGSDPSTVSPNRVVGAVYELTQKLDATFSD